MGSLDLFICLWEMGQYELVSQLYKLGFSFSYLPCLSM